MGIKIDLRNSDLSKINLREANLCYANLQDAKLSYTDLSFAKLSYANLKNAELSHVYLYATQIRYTKFENAILTGACIKDWNINNHTNLNNVTCEYVYFKLNYTDRRPSDPSKIFAPGDFARLVQKTHETVDLIFRNGIDWQAFSNSFQALTAEQIKIERCNRSFSVRAIENLDDGSFVVRINTPKDADKAAIERTFQAKYEAELKQLEAVYRERLQAKDEQIEIYKKQSADIMELTKLAIARDVRTINITGNYIKGTSYTEELKGSGYTRGDNQVNGN
ncbi:MAG: pentapeptide repeat-containing protein [Cyanobacteria bacterium P01_E01_bin.42]